MPQRLEARDVGLDARGVGGQMRDDVDAAVRHVFVVDVAVHVVHEQPLERDAARCAAVFGDDGYAGAVHGVRVVVCGLARVAGAPVRDLQVVHMYI